VAEAHALIVVNPEKLAYVTQTTLSIDDTREVIDALLQRFPMIHGPALSDICYATQNRQNAVRQLSDRIDVLIVVGAHNSSNSNRLREVGKHSGVSAYLIENAADLQLEWFNDVQHIGITAGASTPEILVTEVLERLKNWGITHVEQMDGVNETTTFKIPLELLRA
jgi:4-hydroxy-3-methylbut-2-en-1-yl diphosphate reductase